LLLTVDTNAFGNIWPIDAQDAMQLRNGGTLAGALMTFTWTDPVVVAPMSGAATARRVLLCVRHRASVSPMPPIRAPVPAMPPPAAMRVPSMASAAGTTRIAITIHRNLWATPDRAAINFWCNRQSERGLRQQRGSAPANGGTATNSNQLGGQNPGYYINNQAVRASISATTPPFNSSLAFQAQGFYWGINASDARLKKDIAPTMVDSLARLRACVSWDPLAR